MGHRHGDGYPNDFPVERIDCDMRVHPIHEGTFDIQRPVIARALAGETEYRSAA